MSLIPARDAFTRSIEYPEFSFYHGISDHLDFETRREVQNDDLFRVDEKGVGMEEENISGSPREVDHVLLFLCIGVVVDSAARLYSASTCLQAVSPPNGIGPIDLLTHIDCS